MRPTRSGVVAVASVPALAVAAWLLGQPELSVAAATLAAAVTGCALLVGFRRPRVALRRSVHPARVTVGEPCTIRLRIDNVGSSRTTVIGLHDDLGRYGVTAMHLAPLRVGASREVTCPFPTHRRGLHRVGPLTLRVEDPLGLWRWSAPVGGTGTVIVRPPVHPLAPMPGTPGFEPEQGLRVLSTTATVDEEFASMRPYTVGDDIRRIHWRTTARVGQPVVRQYDQPWQRRTTVLLDLNGGVPDPAAFERAVTVAASVVHASAQQGEIVRLVTTDAIDSGFLVARDHLDALLDRLAAVDPDPSASLAAGLALLGALPTGRLVTVVGRLDAGGRRGWSRATSGYGRRVLVGTETPGSGEGAADRTSDPRTITLRWDGTRTLGEVWAEAMATALDVLPAERVTIG